MPDTSVKILFRFYSDILDAETTETLTAEAVEVESGYFKLTSLSFYAPRIALGDIVWAEYNVDDEMLVYRKTVTHSGSSTIHAIILNEECDLDSILAVFELSGCITARLNDKYFVISVPATVNYIPLKRRLDELQSEKIIDYIESCLADDHQYKNTTVN
jgi:hypothetical protein